MIHLVRLVAAATSALACATWVPPLAQAQSTIEDATEISREQAQQVARELGIPLPSEDEMMAITDEAEQQAALLQGDGLDEGSTS